MTATRPVTLTEIFSEVLAHLAFMFVDDEEVPVDPEWTWLETTIAYQGPVAGVLTLRCPRDFTVHLAANLLGVDSDAVPAEHACTDAVREFMNIVCGQWVTRRYGVEAVFNLTIPTCHALQEAPDIYAAQLDEVATLWVNHLPVQLIHEER